MKRSTQAGALVYSTRPGGPCGDAKPTLEEDDVIVEVDGKPVKDISDLGTITSACTLGKTEPTPVLVAFDRKAERMLTVVKVGIQDLEDPGKEVKKAYLPIGIQVLTSDLAEALGVPGKTGVRVTLVFPNSAATKAGLLVGDLIVAVDGEPIEASQPEDLEVLPAMIRQYKVGSTAVLSVIRNKQPVKVSVVLPESPLLPREMKKFRDNNFEFTVRDIAFTDRVGDKLDKDVVGVLVEDVSQGGWAALGRLMSRDIITTVDGVPVNNVAELRANMERISEQKPKHIVMAVRRGLQELYVELEADWVGTK
jgi:S1-C subfamily serine protease